MLALVSVATACRGCADGKAPERHAASGSARLIVDPLPPRRRRRRPAPTSSRPCRADVAAKVALKEVTTGSTRPVLVAVAPGDARKRLFIVEQHERIRILENGKLLPISRS